METICSRFLGPSSNTFFSTWGLTATVSFAFAKPLKLKLNPPTLLSPVSPVKRAHAEHITHAPSEVSKLHQRLRGCRFRFQPSNSTPGCTHLISWSESLRQLIGQTVCSWLVCPPLLHCQVGFQFPAHRSCYCWRALTAGTSSKAASTFFPSMINRSKIEHMFPVLV